MKLSNLAWAALGYTLGARAGRERYEEIVRVGRRVSGSQTVQTTAGVVQAHLDARLQRARDAVTTRLTGQPMGYRGTANLSKQPPPAPRVSDRPR